MFHNFEKFKISVLKNSEIQNFEKRKNSKIKCFEKIKIQILKNPIFQNFENS